MVDINYQLSYAPGSISCVSSFLCVTLITFVGLPTGLLAGCSTLIFVFKFCIRLTLEKKAFLNFTKHLIRDKNSPSE